jgi:hypothetical protein
MTIPRVAQLTPEMAPFYRTPESQSSGPGIKEIIAGLRLALGVYSIRNFQKRQRYGQVVRYLPVSKQLLSWPLLRTYPRSMI